MTHHLESIAGFVSTLFAAILGSKALPFLAEATSDTMPEWIKWLLGPLGALIGTIAAIMWLTKRLDKAEEREEARRVDREKSMETLAALGVRSNVALEQNSEMLASVRDIIKQKS